MTNSQAPMRTLLLALAYLLSSCALGPSETSAPRSYLLKPEISWKNPHGYSERSGTAVLQIAQPKPQAGFDTARMAYLPRPYELNYYAYNQWADTPARMLQQIMVENLDKSGRWRAVLPAPAMVPAHYRIECDNLVLEQQFFSRPSRMRLALRAQIVDVKQARLLASQSFELFETAPSDDFYGGVQAANRAVEKFLVALAGWIDSAIKETK